MNDFVDECRREWKRLGVPDPVADEMAAELAADLTEAAAEGASAADVLGAAAADPSAFANAWAVERGVIPSGGRRRARRWPAAAAIAASALTAIAGAVLVAFSSPVEVRWLATASPDGLVHVASPDGVMRVISLVPDGGPRVIAASRRYVFPPGSRTAVPAPAPAPLALPVEGDKSGFDARIPGLVLLSLGLAGVAALTSFGLGRAARPVAWEGLSISRRKGASGFRASR